MVSEVYAQRTGSPKRCAAFSCTLRNADVPLKLAEP